MMTIVWLSVKLVFSCSLLFNGEMKQTMRNQQILKGCLVLISLFFYRCTHEYIPPEKEKYNVIIELSFVDPEFWPENQRVELGLFQPGESNSPVVQSWVNPPDDLSTKVTLKDVPQGEYELQVFLTENNIYKVMISDLGQISINGDIKETGVPIKLMSYDRVQRQVFNKCQLCHGGSGGDLAAGLNLTRGNSYASLVNVDAELAPTKKRVLPGNADGSFLIDVLQKDIDFDHSASSSASGDDVQFIIDWINNGAKNEQ